MKDPTRQHRNPWQYSLFTLVLLPPIFAVVFWACRASELATGALLFVALVFGLFATFAIAELCFGILLKRVKTWFHEDGC